MLSEIEIKHACRLDRAMKVTGEDFRPGFEPTRRIYDLIISCLHALSVLECKFDYGQNIKTALRYYHKDSQEYRQQSQAVNEILLDLISQDLNSLCKEIDGENSYECQCVKACGMVHREIDAFGADCFFEGPGRVSDYVTAKRGDGLTDEEIIPKLICDVLHLIEYRCEQGHTPCTLMTDNLYTTAEILHLSIGVFLYEALGEDDDAEEAINQVAMQRLHDNLVAFFEEMKSGISKDVLSQV